MDCNEMFKNKKKVKWQKGFSLIEVLIALTILGILSLFLASSIKTVVDHDDYQENRKYMSQIKQSLITYVQVNGFLPCPDTNGDGREERTGNICNSIRGSLPYQDLGVQDTDYWGNPLYYAVHDSANNVGNIADNSSATSYFNSTAPTPFFNLGTEPTGSPAALGDFLKICTNTTNSCTGSTPAAGLLERAAVAVVLSFGKNGTNTWSKIAATSTVGLSAAEAVNADGNDYFWQSIGTNVDGAEFDDQLIWLTGYEIKYSVLRSGGSLAW